jgi:signal transduction histidine kinase
LSPALEWGERLRRTERFISFIRLAVVLFNSILYLWLSPTHAHHGLAWTIIVVANLYSLVTVFWDPEQLSPQVIPIVNMILDNVLIAFWLYATGGYGSPFFMLFYAEAAASVGRFGWKIGTAAAAGSGVLYIAVVLADGGGPGYQVAARVAYIFFITAFVAYVVENARQVEREALAAEATAEVYNELARLKAAFVSTVSHELRTPLTTIKGATSTLLKNEDRFDPVQTRTLLEMVERQSAHLGKLIQDLIDVATLDQGEIDFLFEWCDITDVVRVEIDRVRASMPQDIKLNVSEAVDTVRCDRALIGRVFRNLLDNASKFSSARDAIQISITSDGGNVFIDVEDSGIGIELQEQENIFDRFYQVDSSLTRRAQGAGIGLNIARELVRLHRGDIKVTSALGDGSRFRVSLPIDPDNIEVLAPPIAVRSA